MLVRPSFPVAEIIIRLGKDGPPVISPLRDVVRVTDGNGSGHSGHGLKREGKEEINRELSPFFRTVIEYYQAM
jgi:hypothetical protein